MKILTEWVTHPGYDNQEVRLDEDGEIVLSLFPEGLDESVCWVWRVRDIFGIYEMHGSNKDKGIARAEGDDAARRYGYTLREGAYIENKIQ